MYDNNMTFRICQSAGILAELCHKAEVAWNNMISGRYCINGRKAYLRTGCAKPHTSGYSQRYVNLFCYKYDNMTDSYNIKGGICQILRLKQSRRDMSTFFADDIIFVDN